MAKTAVIAQLVINLAANSVKFNSALRQSKKKTTSWSKHVRSKVNAANTAFKGMGLAATAAFGVIYTQSAKSIDQLAKTADKLGLTTEALTGLRFAAEQNGVAQTTLDMALQRMTRRLSEAANGTGEAVKAIKELGLDAKKLAASSPEKAFSMISDAMGNVASQSDKVRLTFKFFDSEGVALVNTLALGTEGLNAMAKEAELLGLTVSRFDAAKIEEANNSTKKAQALFTGFGRQLSVKFAPILKGIVDWFTKSVVSAGGMGKVVNKVMTFASKAVGLFADGLRGIHVLFKVGVLQINAMAFAFTKVFSGLVSAVTIVGQTIMKGLVWPIKEVLKLAAKFSDTAKGWLEDVNKFEMAVNQGANSTRQFFEDAAESSSTQLSRSVESLNEILLKPLPSTSLQKFIDNAVKISDEGAAKIVANAPGEKIKNGFIAGTQVLTDKLKQQFASVQTFMMSGEEKIIQAFEKRETIVNEYFDNLVVPNEERRNQILIGLEKKKLDAINKERLKGNNWALKFEKANFAGRAKILGEFGTKMMEATKGQSKKAFKVGKAFALASAAVALPDAVIQSFQKGGGYPWGLIPAGLMLAQGMANISKIKSAQFNGASASGGGAAVMAGGSSVPQPRIASNDGVQSSLPTVEDQADAQRDASNLQSGQIVNNWYISKPQGNDGKRLVEEMREEIINGAELLPPGSRNAETLLEGAA